MDLPASSGTKMTFAEEFGEPFDEHKDESKESSQFFPEEWTTFGRNAAAGRKFEELSVRTVVVDFRRLLKYKTSEEAVKGISNLDLMHAVVALYDVSLSEMTPDVLYSAVCNKYAKTIILMRDVSGTLASMQSRQGNDIADSEESRCETNNAIQLSQHSRGEPDCGIKKRQAHGMGQSELHNKQSLHIHASEENTTNEIINDEQDEEEEEEEDVYEPEESKPSTFSEVFSDNELEEDSSDEDDEEDFSRGIGAFLEAVRERRLLRASHTGPLSFQHVGVEHRIIGAATFEKTFVKPRDRIIHLTFIAVRQRYRKYKIGKYLLSKVKDTLVVGRYDAVVVHADNSATEFFRKSDFCDDVVLNSRWRELAEQYTQCTMMTYLPPFTYDANGMAMPIEVDIASVDAEIEKWRERSMDAYRAEVSCVNRLHHEIVTLRSIVQSHREQLVTLTQNNEKLRNDKYTIEKEFLEYRLLAMKSGLLIDYQYSDSEENTNTLTIN